MNKRKAFIWLTVAALVLPLWGCAQPKDYSEQMTFSPPEILSSVSVSNGAAEEQLYATSGDLSLYIDERKAAFSVADEKGNRWSSIPLGTPDDAAADELLGLIQVHYADQMGNTYELNAMTHSVRKGTAKVMKISGGARIEFSFLEYGFVVPIHITLCKTGVELSVISAQIEENNDLFRLTSVDVAPYFHAAEQDKDGYIFLPDGSGALLDWKQVVDPSVEYRQYVYGRDPSIVQLTKMAQLQTVRLPVFGLIQENTGYTAILTQGESRAAINATAAGKRNQYSNVYAEFIYRESALVKVEKKNQTVTIIENSHTTVPQQTIRYCLMSGEDLSYTDMADAYRSYLMEEEGMTLSAGANGAPLIVEFYGGVMKQQFVMGFPVEQVVALTAFDDAVNILTALKEAGVDNVLVNYTQWQKDATGAAIQTTVQPEGNLGGNRDLQKLLDYCKEQKVSIYLDANLTRMAQSAWGYDKKNDSASSVRRDPAMQYPYGVNTGDADVTSPVFHLKVSKIPVTAEKLAASAAEYAISGLSSSAMGDLLYSDYSKQAITRDHAEYFWSETLQTLASAKGSLIVSGGNAYALNHADLILDAPMDDSGLLLTARQIPFYQIALHGLVDLSVTALNDETDVRRAFLKAVETGSCLKWRWIARNEDELVETDYSHIISSRYENWIGTAAEQYQQAQALLNRIAGCTVQTHETLANHPDVVRVVWSDGTQVLVNYGTESASVNGVTVPAQSFAVKEGS